MITKDASLQKKHMNTHFESELINQLDRFDEIGLEDLDNARLLKRVDTKYLFDIGRLSELLSSVNEYYSILTIGNRKSQEYKSLYLDTEDFQMYLRHHMGKLNRYKVRFRKYINSDLSFLEVKHKNNKSETIKERIEIDYNNFSEKEPRFFIEEYSPYRPEMLTPQIEVRYNRITLVSFSKEERVTIDYNLSYNKLDSYELLPLNNLVIAEVKSKKFSFSSRFIQALKDNHIYPMGFSKYCMGVAMLNKQIKKNAFKPKLIYIDDIGDKLLSA